jgi:PAS domain S-box-containing protein
MFNVDDSRASRGFQLAIGGLAVLSITSLVVTAWILTDFGREQEIVQAITRHLPASDLADARELAGELQLQARLSVLLILNIIATGVALTILVRAYISSERSLREVKVLATDILASMDQGVITTDRNGKIMSINPCGRELLQQTDDGIGMPLQQLPEQHRTLGEICQHVLKHHDGVRDRDYVASQNGHSRTLRAGCSLLQDDKHQNLGTVVHVRDVTEKTLMEQRLRRMERYLGLGSLAAGLHHEIKNPLSALSLHVQLLGEALAETETNPEIQETLGVLNTEVKRISGVLEGFRDYASVSELRRSEVDVSDLIRKLVRLIEPQAKEQNVNIVVRLPEHSLLPVFVDSGRIEQVLLNLAVNALEAMPGGGTLTFSLNETSHGVYLAVADTGRGIPKDLRDKVFDPYFTTRSTGTGMGLALSEKIVRQHDGSIDFDTSPQGTTFSVILPRNEA